MTSKKITNFKDLRVWEEAHALTLEVYELTKTFPKEELYGLTSQLRRSSSSVAANIVEGFYRHSTKELIQFLYLARGSIGEVIYFVILSRDLGYITNKRAGELETRYENLKMGVNALIRSLKKK